MAQVQLRTSSRLDRNGSTGDAPTLVSDDANGSSSSDKRPFVWTRKLSGRRPLAPHVSFSSSSKSSAKSSARNDSLSSPSDSSRGPSPLSILRQAPTPAKLVSNAAAASSKGQPSQHASSILIINRQHEAAWRDSLIIHSPIDPTPPRPFVVYTDNFLPILGAQPTVQMMMQDARAPYFQNSPIFHPRSSALFVTSAPMPDASPSAAPSRHLHVVITKIDLYGPSGWSRDKVRTPDHAYMPLGGCAYIPPGSARGDGSGGLVLCAQGSLRESACLLHLDLKKPHRATPLLTNYHGTPLNSPHSVAVHPVDGALWFTDPHLLHTPSFRPRPQLPPLIYRFDSSTSDLCVLCNDLTRPTALAFAPSGKTLYVIDQAAAPTPSSSQYPPLSRSSTARPSHRGSLTPDAAKTATSSPAGPSSAPFPSASSRSTIYAYSCGSFLSNRRLFALPASDPVALAVDNQGHVYAACPSDGVHVFDDTGTLLGRIMIDGGATGLCFGRAGDLYVSGGERLWHVRLDAEVKGAGLRS